MLTEHGIKKLKKYCREPIENIKGYREAVELDGRYHCHHINELTFTKDELKRMNMYYQRPASELIIMSNSEHKAWHDKWNGHPMTGKGYLISGYKHPLYGKGYLISSEKNPNWKGDKASVSAIYKRAKKLYKAGKISESEFQPYRDAWAEDLKARRNKK